MSDSSIETHKDWQYVEQYYQGDNTAIATLIYNYYKLLIAISYGYTRDYQMSENVIQDVAIELIDVEVDLRIDKLKPNPSKPIGAIMTRVKLRSIDAFRAKVRKKENLDDASSEETHFEEQGYQDRYESSSTIDSYESEIEEQEEAMSVQRLSYLEEARIVSAKSWKIKF